MQLQERIAGKLLLANRWSAEGLVPRGEFERYREQFLHDCVKGWRLKEEIVLDDHIKLVFADQKPLWLRPVALLLPDTKKNLVVDTGVTRALDKLFGLNGPPAALITIGVDDGASNPVAGTTNSTAGSTNRRLVAFASNSRAAKVVTNSGAFTQANANFVHKRLFLSAAAAGTTDAANDLAAMTNVFTLDFTGFSSFSQTYTTTYTGAGS